MPPVEIIAIEVLGETVCHIDTEAIDATIAPKREDVAEECVDLGA